VDNLFALNRTHGYDVADEAIAGLARRLRGNCRERDLVARYAGGKFALVLENCDKAEMLAACERLIEVIGATPFDTSAGPASLCLRIGGVVAPRSGRAAHLLFQHAEEALDLARRPNAPRFVAWEPSAAREDGRMRARKISEEIRAALDDDRIVIALQPLVHASTGLPAFYEALVRLRRLDGVLAPPAAILPTAEKSGLIQRIDQRVLDLAVNRLARDPALQLAVNLSGPTLRDPDFLARLRETLAARPEISRRLILEFSETCAMEDVEAATRVIAMIKHCGARVAMDDFGAGHTSFRNLRRFDFDLVKIDGAFVQNLSSSIDDRFFVRTLVDLARHLGLPVVAEWVEDAETAEILRQWGVEYLQGDFFGAAVVGDEAGYAKL
jgi:diguanylate cyclase (GGDEF)-like protein